MLPLYAEAVLSRVIVYCGKYDKMALKLSRQAWRVAFDCFKRSYRDVANICLSLVRNVAERE